MKLRIIHKLLALLLSVIGLFLSSWIIIPAPTARLLPLGVGAPEVSPWLLLLNVFAFLFSVGSVRHSWWQRFALGCSLVGLILSTLPLLPLSATVQQLSAQMRNGLGTDYQAQIPQQVQTQLRTQPFVVADAFKGIPLTEVRYTAGIPFATPEGIPLKLDIYRPPQLGKYPALVVIYGGAWRSGSPAANPEFNRYMAARGYTVFAIDYRHTPRYRFPTQLKDVQTALAFIREHSAEYEADPDRMALLGRSAGAHLAMLAAYQPDAIPVKAVVNYYGPVDLTKGYFDLPNPNPINVRAVLEAFMGGSPKELPRQYQVASPISYVTKPLPPTLLVYGSRDHIVKAQFGQSLYKQLRAVGSTAVFLEIPWAEHAFDAIFNGVSNQLTLYYTERFLAWALH